MKAVSFILKCVVTAQVLFAAAVLPFNASAVDLVSAPDASFSPPVSAGGDSYNPLISADGHYVLFTSAANNLAHRTNGAPYILAAPLKQNVFLRDRVQGTTTLISVDSTGAKAGEDDSTPTGISTNGQYVLFETASRLVPDRDSTNRLNTSEVYLRDVVNKTTTLVSIRTNSQFNAGARESVMTPDARYVAFESSDANFVAGDTNNASDVFVRDLVSGETQMASAGFSNRIWSSQAEITPDGKFVTFIGFSFSANPTQDVYVCDMAASNTFCVSTNSHQFLAGVPWCYGQRISDDGKYVAYQANVLFGGPTISAFIFRHNIQTGTDDLVTSNSVPAASALAFDMSPDGRFIAFIGKTNSSTGVFLWDGQTGASTFVSVDTNGLTPASMTCEAPRVDPTGRFVSFFGTANGLVTNATGNFLQHIYRRDMQSGITELVDAGIDGNATNRILNTDFSMSADGRFIAFDSPDTDLVVPDGNNVSDVFARDLTAETTGLVSASEPNLMTQTGGYGDYRSRVRVSADGRFAVFIAHGNGLVPGQTNRFRQIFARDLINQSNFLVSVDTNGLGNANGLTTDCAISDAGRYIAFTSYANNLVPNDTNGGADVFLRDLQTGTTTRVSTNQFDPGGGGNPGTGNGNWTLQNLSLEGRFIAYGSPTLSGPLHIQLPFQSLFVYDQSQPTNCNLASNGVSSVATTPDGRYVAFSSQLIPGGTPNVYVWDSQLRHRVFTNLTGSWVTNMAISTNGQWMAYTLGTALRVIDRLTKSNISVSAGPFGLRPNPRFSGDGRYLVYATAASNSAQDTNLSRDVYVFDILTRSNLLVSRSFFTGNAATGNSELPDISADGRYITYESDAPDIVPGDNNGQKDIFLYDQQSGSTMLLSASLYGNGTADYESQAPRFTADGQTVAFQSWASDLTANDFNQGSDLFLLKIVNPIGSTNPPPVFTGQIIFSPGSGGSGPGQASPQLTWAAAPGVGYQVQYKTNLTDNAWLPVNGSVVIQNGRGYINDLAPDPDHRFYRIVGF